MYQWNAPKERENHRGHRGHRDHNILFLMLLFILISQFVRWHGQSNFDVKLVHLLKGELAQAWNYIRVRRMHIKILCICVPVVLYIYTPVEYIFIIMCACVQTATDTLTWTACCLPHVDRTNAVHSVLILPRMLVGTWIRQQLLNMFWWLTQVGVNEFEHYPTVI